MSDRICATCKHWEPEEWIRKSIADPDTLNADYHEGHCQVLQDTLEIEENATTGYYSSGGDNGIAKVETPWDFGCNKWEERKD